MRKANINRKTSETEVSLTLSLDGAGKYSVRTGCGFLDHMLELFSAHSGFDLTVSAKGDTHVDYHHTVEDVGICLGQAFLAALGGKQGIARYGDIILPMDETLVMAAIDISGRCHINFDISFPDEYKVGDFDTELAEEFFAAFVREAKVSLHIKKLYGTNAHHIIEGAFKAFARILKTATAICGNKLPSTKGTL